MQPGLAFVASVLQDASSVLGARGPFTCKRDKQFCLAPQEFRGSALEAWEHHFTWELLNIALTAEESVRAQTPSRIGRKSAAEISVARSKRQPYRKKAAYTRKWPSKASRDYKQR